MPGNGEDFEACSEPEDLPPKCKWLYDNFFTEDFEYVVNFEGKTGLLLTARYDEYYCCNEVCGFSEMPDDNQVEDIMALEYLILKKRASKMETTEAFSSCTILLGEYTDPVGHELALFIPIEEIERKEEIKAEFERNCWGKGDRTKLKSLLKTLTQEA